MCSLLKAFDHPGKVSGYEEPYSWLRRSIFWDLPCWSKLLIRHNLDVMHIEKNVFEQVINTIMNMRGKSKDDINSRNNLVMHCKCTRLIVQLVDDGVGGRRKLMLPAPYVFNREKRKVLCEFISGLRFPDRYA